MKTCRSLVTVFKRDMATNMKTLLEGQYSEPAFAFLRDNEWVWTEKVDGTNIRVMIAAPDLPRQIELFGPLE